MYGATWTYSNEFTVIDGEKFEEAMEDHPIDVIGTGNCFELYGLDADEHPALWPCGPDGKDDEFFYKLVATHLAPDSVAVFYTFDIDNEVSSYMAFSVAVNASGQMVRVDVNDIVGLSAGLAPASSGCRW